MVAGGSVNVCASLFFAGLNETLPELFEPQSQPFGGEPACSLKVCGGLQLATPVPVDEFGGGAGSSLKAHRLQGPLQETNAGTSGSLISVVFVGCWNAHCAATVLPVNAIPRNTTLATIKFLLALFIVTSSEGKEGS
jgi:hypothetical protein